jgi:hypothetical protein
MSRWGRFNKRSLTDPPTRYTLCPLVEPISPAAFTSARISGGRYASMFLPMLIKEILNAHYYIREFNTPTKGASTEKSSVNTLQIDA